MWNYLLGDNVVFVEVCFEFYNIEWLYFVFIFVDFVVNLFNEGLNYIGWIYVMKKLLLGYWENGIGRYYLIMI